MKIKVDESLEFQIDTVLNKIILFRNRLYVFSNPKYTEEERKTFFGKTVKTRYLVELDVLMMSKPLRELGHLSDNGVEGLLFHCNIATARQDWLELIDQLNALGFEIKKKE